MPSARSSLKRDPLRRKLGLSHHALAIRRHQPWYLRMGYWLLAVLVGAVLVLLYQFAEHYFSPRGEEILRLRDEIKVLNGKIDELTQQAGTAPNVALMAQAAQQTCAQQLEKSQRELSKVREELAYCEKNARHESGVVRRAPIQIPGAGTIPAGSPTNPNSTH